MMFYLMLGIFSMISIGGIGTCIFYALDCENLQYNTGIKIDKSGQLKAAMVFVYITLFINFAYIVGTGEKTYEPSAPGDTMVDKMMDEVRMDDKGNYTDDEVQILVYKYLLKYTREGRYEVIDENEKKLLREAGVEGY